MLMIPVEYPDDCLAIQVCLLKKGYTASLLECERLWEMYSEGLAAGWIFLPDTEEDIWNAISSYVMSEQDS